MNIIELIKTRRTIKKFKPTEIDQNSILSWLEAAAFAPNHRMTEPWEIYFIGEETREKLNHKTNFGNAPVVLMILSKRGAASIETEENALATACFIQNFNLAAWAEGVGTFWSSIGMTAKNRVILGVSDDFDIIGVLGVGYPEITPEPRPRTPIKNKIINLP